jgi:transcriptional regulator with XRE-family HTH domain
MTEISKIVLKYRENHKMTQVDFADFIGISNRTVIKVELGEDVGYSTLKKIAEKLGYVCERDFYFKIVK